MNNEESDFEAAKTILHNQWVIFEFFLETDSLRSDSSLPVSYFDILFFPFSM